MTVDSYDWGFGGVIGPSWASKCAIASPRAMCRFFAATGVRMNVASNNLLTTGALSGVSCD